MINFWGWKTLMAGTRQACLLLALLMSPSLALGAAKYKKSTVIDFEGALVEGKSRKPYSAYLTQQKDSAFGELHQWQPDLDKSLQDSQTKLGNTP